MMDTILLIAGLICVITGVFGSFLPGLPGPSISWIGLLLLYLTVTVPNNYWVLGITLVITLTITILDYVIPSKGIKKFGGSKYGVWGANIGLVVGFFIPVSFGFIIGVFVGALVGELMYDHQDKKRALKAASGSLLGFLVSSFMKFIFCILYVGLYICVAVKYFWILK